MTVIARRRAGTSVPRLRPGALAGDPVNVGGCHAPNMHLRLRSSVSASLLSLLVAVLWLVWSRDRRYERDFLPGAALWQQVLGTASAGVVHSVTASTMRAASSRV